MKTISSSLIALSLIFSSFPVPALAVQKEVRTVRGYTSLVSFICIDLKRPDCDPLDEGGLMFAIINVVVVVNKQEVPFGVIRAFADPLLYDHVAGSNKRCNFKLRDTGKTLPRTGERVFVLIGYANCVAVPFK
jgi:hypothetical protein